MVRRVGLRALLAACARTGAAGAAGARPGRGADPQRWAARQHVDLLHPGRQWGERRGRLRRGRQREQLFQPRARAARGGPCQHRQAGWTGNPRPLHRRLGDCHQHALRLGEAGGAQLWRHPQRHDPALAARLPGEGRGANPVARARSTGGRWPKAGSRRPPAAPSSSTRARTSAATTPRRSRSTTAAPTPSPGGSRR